MFKSDEQKFQSQLTNLKERFDEISLKQERIEKTLDAVARQAEAASFLDAESLQARFEELKTNYDTLTANFAERIGRLETSDGRVRSEQVDMQRAMKRIGLLADEVARKREQG